MLKQAEPTVNLSASIPLSAFQRLVDVAAAERLSRSRTVKELILLGLEKYDASKNTESQTNNKGE